MNLIKSIQTLQPYGLTHASVFFALRFIHQHNLAPQKHPQKHQKTHKAFAQIFKISDRVVTRCLQELINKELIEFETLPRIGRGKPQRTYGLTATFTTNLHAMPAPKIGQPFQNFVAHYFNLDAKEAKQWSGLKPSEALILLALMTGADAIGLVANTPHTALASATGLNKITIKKRLKHLMSAEFIICLAKGFNETKFLGRQTNVYLLNALPFNAVLPLAEKHIRPAPITLQLDTLTDPRYSPFLAPDFNLVDSPLDAAQLCIQLIGKRNWNLLEDYLRPAYLKSGLHVKRRLVFNLAQLASKVFNQSLISLPDFSTGDTNLTLAYQYSAIDYQGLIKQHYKDVIAVSQLKQLDATFLSSNEFKVRATLGSRSELNKAMPSNLSLIEGHTPLMTELRLYYLVCAVLMACKMKKTLRINQNNPSLQFSSFLDSFQLIGPMETSGKHFIIEQLSVF